MSAALVRNAFLLGVVGTVAFASAGHAETDDVSRAKSFFDAGKAFFEAGKYADAALAFHESHRLAPRAATVYSEAQAHRLQYWIDHDPARLVRAASLYRQYLEKETTGGRKSDAIEHLAAIEPIVTRIEEERKRSGKALEVLKELRETQLMISCDAAECTAALDGGDRIVLPAVKTVRPGVHRIDVEAAGFVPTSLERTAVEGRLVAVDVKLVAKPARVEVVAPEGADIFLSGRPVGEAMAALPPFEVPAGRHLVTVTQLGKYPFQQEIDVKRGEELRIDVPLETTQQRTVAWTLGIGSGALAVAGSVFMVMALNAEGRAVGILDRHAAAENLTMDDLKRLDRDIASRNRSAIVSGSLFGTAAAALVTGVLLYVLDQPRLDPYPRDLEGSRP